MSASRATHPATSAQTVWTIGSQILHLGDSLPLMAAMPPASVDVCVTSPPYNIGVAYRSHDDRMPRPDYLAWMARAGTAIARVLKPDGSLFLNVGATSLDPWIAWEVARAVGADLCLQNQIVWVKSISVGLDTHGHFKPLNSRRYLNNNFEFVFHFTKAGDTPIDRLAIGVEFQDKSNIARWGHARDLRCAGNVWFIPYKTVMSRAQKFHHPAGFPVDLPLRCIRLHGKADATVLDPFAGVGATLVAAQRFGARGIGVETDRGYAEAAAARLAAEAG